MSEVLIEEYLKKKISDNTYYLISYKFFQG